MPTASPPTPAQNAAMPARGDVGYDAFRGRYQKSERFAGKRRRSTSSSDAARAGSGFVALRTRAAAVTNTVTARHPPPSRSVSTAGLQSSVRSRWAPRPSRASPGRLPVSARWTPEHVLLYRHPVDMRADRRPLHAGRRRARTRPWGSLRVPVHQPPRSEDQGADLAPQRLLAALQEARGAALSLAGLVRRGRHDGRARSSSRWTTCSTATISTACVRTAHRHTGVTSDKAGA